MHGAYRHVYTCQFLAYLPPAASPISRALLLNLDIWAFFGESGQAVAANGAMLALFERERLSRPFFGQCSAMGCKGFGGIGWGEDWVGMGCCWVKSNERETGGMVCLCGHVVM